MRKHIDIVFADVPNTPDCTFVEVEDENGRSMRAGEWVKRPDGLSALRITQAAFGTAAREALDDALNALGEVLPNDHPRRAVLDRGNAVLAKLCR